MTICYKKFKTITVLTFIVRITIGKFPIIFQFFLIQAKRIPFYFHFKVWSFKNTSFLFEGKKVFIFKICNVGNKHAFLFSELFVPNFALENSVCQSCRLPQRSLK